MEDLNCNSSLDSWEKNAVWGVIITLSKEMLYLVHRTGNSNNTVFRYVKDLQKYLGERKIDTQIIAPKIKDNKSSNLVLDLFYKNLNYQILHYQCLNIYFIFA